MPTQPSSRAASRPLHTGPLVRWARGCVWSANIHYFSVYIYFTNKFLIIKKWDFSCFPSFSPDALPARRGSTCPAQSPPGPCRGRHTAGVLHIRFRHPTRLPHPSVKEVCYLCPGRRGRKRGTVPKGVGPHPHLEAPGSEEGHPPPTARPEAGHHLRLESRPALEHSEGRRGCPDWGGSRTFRGRIHEDQRRGGLHCKQGHMRGLEDTATQAGKATTNRDTPQHTQGDRQEHIPIHHCHAVPGHPEQGSPAIPFRQ